MVKELLLLLIFYLLALLQTSFLPRLTSAAFSIYLIFITIFFLIFFNSRENWFLPVFFGGFFLDVFSGGIFGLKTLSLLLTALFLKFLLSFFSRRDFFWFIFIFLTSFIFYNFSFFLFQICFKGGLTLFVFKPINLIYPVRDLFSLSSYWLPLISNGVYNLAFAILGLCIFYFSKKTSKITT